MNAGELVSFVKKVFVRWNRVGCSRMAAALAFYAVFSLAPLLLIVLTIANILLSEKMVQEQIIIFVKNWIGIGGVEVVENLLSNIQLPNSWQFATVAGFFIVFLGASKLFDELHRSLNIIWNIEHKKASNILFFIKHRIISFLFVIGASLLLFATFVGSILFALANQFLANFLLYYQIIYNWHLIDIFGSFGFIMLLFIGAYRIIPDVDVRWKNAAGGALAASLLFIIGKFVIGWYFETSGVGSVYGAAGSLIVFLLWIYYSAQIFLLGAVVVMEL